MNTNICTNWTKWN